MKYTNNMRRAIRLTPECEKAIRDAVNRRSGLIGTWYSTQIQEDNSVKLDMTESRAKAEGGASGSMNHLQELAARVSSARGGVPAVACLSAAVAREMGIPDDAGDLVVDEDGYEWRVIKRKGGETWVAGRGSL